jgi:TetR/AcrR family transcriptional repressor of bet genes
LVNQSIFKAPTMPRASNTEVRRAEIVDAFVSVVAKHGYDGASVASIARRAHLTAGLVHYHFDDKREILVEAVRALARKHASVLDAALAGSDAPAQLAAFVDVHLGLGAHADAEALAAWVVVVAESLRDKKVRAEVEAVLADMIRRLADVLQRGHAAKHFACRDVDAAAAAIVATIQGYFTVAATARGLIPSGSAAGCTLRMVEGLVHPAKPLPMRKRTERTSR